MGDLTVSCAWCGRLKDFGVWGESLLIDAGNIQVSHGICPDCVDVVKAEWHNEAQTTPALV